ncbi:MAG: SPOR domain-containing protein, partial [Rectinemataceae bacterium]
FPPVANADLKPFDITGRSPAKPQEPTDYVALPTIVVEPSGSGTQETSQNSPSGSDTRIVIVSPASGSNTSPSTGSAAPTTSGTTGTAPAATETKPVAKPAEPPASAPAPAKPAVKQPAPPAPTPAAQAAPPSPTKTEPAIKVSPPAPEATQAGNYWIQVGSFSSKSTAEKLRDEFTSRNLSAIITIKDISGKSYYQVKVGPYPSAEEAKKWLLTAKSVPGASQEAFVTNK